MKRLLFILSILFFTACSTEPPRYQEFVENGHKVLVKDTELGALWIGNFDFFLSKKKGVLITFRFKFWFEDGIGYDEQEEFKEKFFESFEKYWSTNPYYLKGNNKAIAKRIPINFKAEEVFDNSFHKIVVVDNSWIRAFVSKNVNLHEGSDHKTIAHEVGHVFGLRDEYDGGSWENMMWHGDKDHEEDHRALMNNGQEMRARYFEHVKEEVLSFSPRGSQYTIEYDEELMIAREQKMDELGDPDDFGYDEETENEYDETTGETEITEALEEFEILDDELDSAYIELDVIYHIDLDELDDGAITEEFKELLFDYVEQECSDYCYEKVFEMEVWAYEDQDDYEEDIPNYIFTTQFFYNKDGGGYSFFNMDLESDKDLPIIPLPD